MLVFVSKINHFRFHSLLSTLYISAELDDNDDNDDNDDDNDDNDDNDNDDNDNDDDNDGDNDHDNLVYQTVSWPSRCDRHSPHHYRPPYHHYLHDAYLLRKLK